MIKRKNTLITKNVILILILKKFISILYFEFEY